MSNYNLRWITTLLKTYRPELSAKWILSILWMIKFTVIQKKTFGTWQFDKIGVLVNLIIQKLKSKHLVSLSQFLWWEVKSERIHFAESSGLIAFPCHLRKYGIYPFEIRRFWFQEKTAQRKTAFWEVTPM